MTPTSVTYSAASGRGAILGGMYAAVGAIAATLDAAAFAGSARPDTPPTYVAALPTRQWSALSGSTFSTWANAGGITGSGYLGSNPINSIVNAFSSPAFDASAHKAIFGGGGHVDGSCNAYVEFDLYTLAYRQVATATPPVKYPPSYQADLVYGITYPSSAEFRYFHDGLTDPADTAYNVTNYAPIATHQWSSMCIRGREILKPGYYGVGWLNLDTGLWRNLQRNPIGPTLQTAGTASPGAPNLTAGIVERDVASEYDSVTDRVYMTVGPGDSGINTRGGLAILNPTSMVVEQYIACGQVNFRTRIAIIGRYLYIFTATGSSSAWDTTLVRVNMDTRALEYCSVTGNLFTWDEAAAATVFSGGGTAPDPTSGIIYRWDYYGNRDALYAVNTVPISGLGTVGSPYVMQQTRIALTASSMGMPSWAERMNVSWGVLYVHHSATGGWWACKL